MVALQTLRELSFSCSSQRLTLIHMLPPLIRTTSFLKLVKKSSTFRFISVSSLSQLPSSDENNTNFFSIDKLNKFEVIETMHKLNRAPNNALSFISRLKEDGFKHDVVTYMSIVRFLCQWGKDRMLYSLFMDVIDDNNGELHSFEIPDLCDALMEEIEMEGLEKLIKAIDVLVKVYASVGRFEEAIDTLYKIKRGRVLLSTRTCNYLMNQLIEWDKLDMVESVYRQLKMKGLIPNVYTYGILIKALCRKGCLEEAVDVFTQMTEAGVEPNAFTFGTYIDGLCSNGKTDSAFQLIKSLRELNQPVNPYAYISVIRGLVKESKLQDAENVLLEMNHTKVVPDAECYCVLIHGYGKKGDINRALELHEEMASRGIKTNSVIVSSIMQCFCGLGRVAEAEELFDSMKSRVFLDEIAFNIAIDGLCKAGNMEKAMELFKEMKGKNMKPDVVHYTTLINGYCLHGKPWKAFEIFEKMKRNGLKPDFITFDVLAGGLSRCGLYEETIDLVHDMQTQGIEPSNITHNLVIEGLCKGDKMKEAEDYFISLPYQNLDNYAAMMNGYCEAKNTRDALKLVFYEKRLFTKRASCLKLVTCLCEEGELKQAMRVFRAFAAASNKGPCKSMYSEIIYLLCRNEEMGTARRLFDEMIEKGFTPDVVTYTMMMNSYCRVKRLNEARDLLIDMKIREIKPDIYTHTVLLHGARTNKDLKDHTDEFKKTCLPFNVNCYTVMIDKHCRLHNLQEAIRLFQEMKDKGVEPNTFTYTVLIRGLNHHGYAKEAEKLSDEMILKGIELNISTIRALQMEAKLVKFNSKEIWGD